MFIFNHSMTFFTSYFSSFAFFSVFLLQLMYVLTLPIIFL